MSAAGEVTRLCFRHFRLGQLAPVTGRRGQLSQRCAGEGVFIPARNILDGVVRAIVAADHIAHLGDIPGYLCGSCSLLGCGSSVGLIALYLHTAIGTIPINIEPDPLANVRQLHIVVAVDDIGFHLHLLPIYIDTVIAALGHDSGGIGRRGDAHQQQTGHKSGCKISSLHGESLLIICW